MTIEFVSFNQVDDQLHTYAAAQGGSGQPTIPNLTTKTSVQDLKLREGRVTVRGTVVAASDQLDQTDTVTVTLDSREKNWSETELDELNAFQTSLAALADDLKVYTEGTPPAEVGGGGV